MLVSSCPDKENQSRKSVRAFLRPVSTLYKLEIPTFSVLPPHINPRRYTCTHITHIQLRRKSYFQTSVALRGACGSVVKHLPANTGDTGDVGSIPWGRKWQPTPVFLPGKSYGQSMEGHSPWGRKELDTTKREHKRATLMFQPAQAPRLA